MSGWIKWEKPLETDPRVLRMARKIDRRFTLFDTQVTDDTDPSNASALPAVTWVCGALLRLWSYADTHIRSDDMLEVGPDEIDQIVGLPGFSEICPSDWLEVIDEETVKLPDYQEHNGTEARRKAQVQKRVERHRNRKALQGSNADVTHKELPDLDQDLDLEKEEKDPPAPDGAGRSTPSTAQPIPDDWQPNEVNRAWLEKAGLSEVQRDEVVGEFVRWAQNSGHRKKNWDLAFSRNPAVKSAVGRARSNGGSHHGTDGYDPVAALRRHCKDGHNRSQVVEEDPVLARAADELGGMQKLRNMGERDFSRLEPALRGLYARLQRNGAPGVQPERRS